LSVETNIVSFANESVTPHVMSARGRTAGSPDELADRWHSLAIHLLRRLRREDSASALTGPRLSALSVIVFGGPVTLGELAAAEQVKPPTMTRLVSALEAAGLVRRESDRDDRRIVRLRATAKGEQLLYAGRARRVKRLAEPIAALTAAERRTLADAADVLASVVARLS
jgi:DNA-binding MarR family transcriptional regulator